MKNLGLGFFELFLWEFLSLFYLASKIVGNNLSNIVVRQVVDVLHEDDVEIGPKGEAEDKAAEKEDEQVGGEEHELHEFVAIISVEHLFSLTD